MHFEFWIFLFTKLLTKPINSSNCPIDTHNPFHVNCWSKYLFFWTDLCLKFDNTMQLLNNGNATYCDFFSSNGNNPVIQRSVIHCMFWLKTMLNLYKDNVNFFGIVSNLINGSLCIIVRYLIVFIMPLIDLKTNNIGNS